MKWWFPRKIKTQIPKLTDEEIDKPNMFFKSNWITDEILSIYKSNSLGFTGEFL